MVKWFPIIMVFFIVVLILVLLRVRRARRLRVGNATVVTAGEVRTLNSNSGMIDGRIVDSGNRSRQPSYQNLIIWTFKCFKSKTPFASNVLIIALIYKSSMLFIKSNRARVAFLTFSTILLSYIRKRLTSSLVFSSYPCPNDIKLYLVLFELGDRVLIRRSLIVGTMLPEKQLFSTPKNFLWKNFLTFDNTFAQQYKNQKKNIYIFII